MHWRPLVRSSSSRLPPSPSTILTHNLFTHNLFTHNLFTHTQLSHNFITHNSLTQLTHTQLNVRVAGVALGDIDLHFVWQAWHLWHWAGSGGALGSRLTLWSPRLFAWQAWHLVTSTFTLCVGAPPRPETKSAPDTGAPPRVAGRGSGGSFKPKCCGSYKDISHYHYGGP